MKIIKPQGLGILHRAHRFRGTHRLVVVGLGFFNLGEFGKHFLPETDGWPKALDALAPGDVLDMVMPKVAGEVLMAAKAFAPGGNPVSEMTVRLAVDGGTGAVDKTLRVLGNRAWSRDGHAWRNVADPDPFATMPITYDRAFGGPAFPLNPLGRGFTEEGADPAPVDDGVMPNIEYADDPVCSPHKAYTPAGFGPLDIRGSLRQAKAGTYDQRWLEAGATGLPDDIDPGLFNAASDDQQLSGFFRGGERYRLEGMHPESDVIEGALPSFQVRAFCQRRGQQPENSEAIACVFDTVWLFPEHRLGLALYRGQTSVEDSDALDIETLMLGYEHRDAPKPEDHYREVMALRLDPKTAPAHALHEAQLIPLKTEDELAVLREEQRQAEADDREARQAALAETMSEIWEQSGLEPPADFVPPVVEPPLLEVIPKPALERGDVDLTAFLASAERAVAEARQQGDEHRGRLEAWTAEHDLQKLKQVADPRAEADAAEARASEVAVDLVDSALPDTGPLPHASVLDGWDPGTEHVDLALARLAPLKRAVRQAAPTPTTLDEPLGEEAAQRLRSYVQELLRQGVSLAGRDLAGADLRGLDLRGVDLRETMLERADLSGCSLQEANLARAALTSAKLQSADLSGAKLTGANLCHVQAVAVSFVEADLSEVQAREADLSRGQLRSAKLRGMFAPEVNLRGADLEGVDLSESILFGAKADGACFAHATMDRTVLYGASLVGARLDRVQALRAVFTDVKADRSSWRGARLERCHLGGNSQFREALMQELSALHCGWRGADLTAADLGGSQIVSCDLGECSLRRAPLSGVLLYRSVLSGADLRDCIADGADFYRALCRKTDFRGADMGSANFVGALTGEAQFGNRESGEAQ